MDTRYKGKTTKRRRPKSKDRAGGAVDNSERLKVKQVSAQETQT
jgi:hypothetical protein